MFPTCSEILEVIKDLGYIKMAGAQGRAGASPDSADASAVQANS